MKTNKQRSHEGPNINNADGDTQMANEASNFAARVVNADEHIHEVIAGFGFTPEEAAKIVGTFIKVKALKRAGVEWKFTHGAFVDRDVMLRALSA